jgi:hypothetical protein
MSPNSNFNLDWIFSYHSPSPEQLPRYAKIRAAAKEFAQVILDETPFCADQSASLRCVREACLWANSAVALEGSLLGPVNIGGRVSIPNSASPSEFVEGKSRFELAELSKQEKEKETQNE